MKNIKAVTGLLVLVSILGPLGAFLLPTPGSWTGSEANFHSELAVSLTFALLHTGAMVLFMMGASAYTAELQKAYRLLTVGITLMAAALAQFPVLNALGLSESAWITSGAMMLPFLAASTLSYVGVRRMAGLIGVQTIGTRYGWVFLLAAATAALSVPLPHGDLGDLREVGVDAVVALSAWNMVVFGAAILMVRRLKGSIGAHYTAAMSWLALGLASTFLSTVVTIVVVLSGNLVDGRSHLVNATVIAAGIVYLKGGYEFARTREI